MKPGHYVTGYNGGWGVFFWNGEKVIYKKFVGRVGAIRTNFFDKAMALADERNRRDGFDVGGGVYYPTIQNLEKETKNIKMDHFLIGPQSDENNPLEQVLCQFQIPLE